MTVPPIVMKTRHWLASGDRWIPALFVLFFVGLALLEARLIQIAVSTSTGLVTRAGPAAPQPGAAAWRIRLDLVPRAGADTAVSVQVVDRDGRRVPALSVRLVAERPSRFAQIVAVTLRDDGHRHVGFVRLPIGGRWDVSVIASDGRRSHRITSQFDVAAGDGA